MLEGGEVGEEVGGVGVGGEGDGEGLGEGEGEVEKDLCHGVVVGVGGVAVELHPGCGVVVGVV